MRCILPIIVITLLASPAVADDEKAPPKYEFKLKAVEVKNTDTPLAKLLKERYNAAIDIARNEMLRVETGLSNILALGEAMDLLVGAGLELFTDSKERIALLEESLGYSRHAEQLAMARYQAGAAPKSEAMKAKYIRCTAEIRLLRATDAKRP